MTEKTLIKPSQCKDDASEADARLVRRAIVKLTGYDEM